MTRLNNACVVEQFFNEPYWRMTIFALIDSNNQFVTNLSQIFDKVEVSEIGRKSLEMSLGTDFWGTGITSAFFQMEGTTDS